MVLLPQLGAAAPSSQLKTPVLSIFLPSPHPCYVPPAPCRAPAAVAAQHSPHGRGDPQLPPEGGREGGQVKDP